MASTAAERKRKEREEKKAQGMVQKAIWLLPDTIKIIDEYKKQFNSTDEEAINELIKKALN
jgi:CRISPR/Cas system-associated endonuclease Cas3-HD